MEGKALGALFGERCQWLWDVIDGSVEMGGSALGGLWSGGTGNRRKVPGAEEMVLGTIAGIIQDSPTSHSFICAEVK